MPFYVYRREDGTTFEKRQSIMDDPLDLCPETGQKVKRVIFSSPIVFKLKGGLDRGDYKTQRVDTKK